MTLMFPYGGKKTTILTSVTMNSNKQLKINIDSSLTIPKNRMSYTSNSSYEASITMIEKHTK